MLNSITFHTRPLTWLIALRRAFVRAMPITTTIDSGQVQRFHCAFHKIYREFAAQHPEWIARRVDDDFLRQTIIVHSRWHVAGSNVRWVLPTAQMVAWAWDQKFGALFERSSRIERVTSLIPILEQFLARINHEM